MGGGSDQGPLGTTVSTTEIEDLAVTTAKLAAGAVTAAKTTGIIPQADNSSAPQDIAITDSQWTSPTTCTASSNGTLSDQTLSTQATADTFDFLYAGYMIRVGQKFSTGHTVVGKTVDGFTATLKKVGAPTGTLTCNVRSSADAIKLQLGTLDVSTLTGSDAAYKFQNLTGVVIADGDRITLEYSGGDASNYVYFRQASSSVQANTVMSTYLAAWADSIYDLTFIVHGQAAADPANMKDDKANPTTATHLTSSEAGAWIKGDFASAQVIVGIALHLASGTNPTSLQLYTSADDVTYTKVRDTLLTAFTLGAWNLWYFNRRPTTIRYLKVVSADAGAKVIKCNEMAGLILSESAMNARHGHKAMSSTDTALDLEGD